MLSVFSDENYMRQALVEAQAAAVDDGLPQRPEQHRAVKAAQHLGHIGGVGKGQILEYDQIRRERVEIGAQIVVRRVHRNIER